MPRRKQLDIYYESIQSLFENADRRSFTDRSIYNFLSQAKENELDRLTKSNPAIIDFLKEKKDLKEHLFILNDIFIKRVKVHAWRTENEYTIASALKNHSYYTHYTAMFMHGLTLQIPKTLYLNFERVSNFREKQQLSQEAIDKAFSKAQRKSHVEYNWRNKRITLINGMYTGRTGVIQDREGDKHFSYTDLERTLIDIAVRPAYSGGVFEVLEAYKNAKSKVDTFLMHTYLEKMDYIYPYHQVIGFYLENAGYSKKEYSFFEGEKDLKFYLTYNIRKPLFSEKWQLYYPTGF